MPKNDNAKSLRLYESVKLNIGADAADKMFGKLYLSKSADFTRKFKWANDVCTYLEENYDGEQIKRIRMGCSCSPSPSLIAKIKRLYKNSADIDDFIRVYELSKGGSFSLYRDGDSLVFVYPTCYCDCVNRIDRSLPETWCLCTLGYTKKLFDAVFERDTCVILLESIKTGGEKCVIKVTM